MNVNMTHFREILDDAIAADKLGIDKPCIYKNLLNVRCLLEEVARLHRYDWIQSRFAEIRDRRTKPPSSEALKLFALFIHCGGEGPEFDNAVISHKPWLDNFKRTYDIDYQEIKQ